MSKPEEDPRHAGIKAAADALLRSLKRCGAMDRMRKAAEAQVPPDQEEARSAEVASGVESFFSGVTEVPAGPAQRKALFDRAHAAVITPDFKTAIRKDIEDQVDPAFLRELFEKEAAELRENDGSKTTAKATGDKRDKTSSGAGAHLLLQKILGRTGDTKDGKNALPNGAPRKARAMDRMNGVIRAAPRVMPGKLAVDENGRSALRPGSTDAGRDASRFVVELGEQKDDVAGSSEDRGIAGVKQNHVSSEKPPTGDRRRNHSSSRSHDDRIIGAEAASAAATLATLRQGRAVVDRNDKRDEVPRPQQVPTGIAKQESDEKTRLMEAPSLGDITMRSTSQKGTETTPRLGLMEALHRKAKRSIERKASENKAVLVPKPVDKAKGVNPPNSTHGASTERTRPHKEPKPRTSSPERDEDSDSEYIAVVSLKEDRKTIGDATKMVNKGKRSRPSTDREHGRKPKRRATRSKTSAKKANASGKPRRDPEKEGSNDTTTMKTGRTGKQQDEALDSPVRTGVDTKKPSTAREENTDNQEGKNSSDVMKRSFPELQNPLVSDNMGAGKEEIQVTDKVPQQVARKRPRTSGHSDMESKPQDYGEQKKVMMAIQELLKEDFAEHFAEPVDPTAEGCANYYEVIKNPMDFGTIFKRLEEATPEKSFYRTSAQAVDDCELVWSNCRTFNGTFDEICLCADECKNRLGILLEEFDVAFVRNQRGKGRRSRGISSKRKFAEEQMKQEVGHKKKKRTPAKQGGPNDGRLVGKTVLIFSAFSPSKKSWKRATLTEFDSATSTYALRWHGSEENANNVSFGPNGIYPVYREA